MTEPHDPDDDVRPDDERWRRLVEEVRDYAIFMLDPGGTIRTWNRGVARTLGWDEVGFVGLPFAAIFTPEDRAAGVPQQEIERAAAEGRAEDERWHLCRDGRRFWASGVTTPIRDETGTLRGFTKIMRDRTERLVAEEERRRLLAEAEAARAEAERAAALRERFIGIASHELHTPLSVIKGYAQLLARSLRGPTIDRDLLFGHLTQQLAQVDRMEALLADLLDISRLREDQLDLRPVPFDLAALAAEVLHYAEQTPERTPRHALLLDAPAPVRGTWDRVRLDQVLTNLVSNALKYSPEGGPVRVRVRQPEPGWAEVGVGDEGLGISLADQAHIFEPFARAAAGRARAKGVGLGLSITAQIVERHGGTIAVASTLGAGSTFTVRLPLAPPERRHDA